MQQVDARRFTILLGTCYTAMLEGIEGTVVRVEADVSPGIPQFSIVGLPDSSVRESKLRVRAALRNSGLDFPNQRITVNLSPAGIRKRGAGLDLPIAIAILRASRQVPPESALQFGFCAELGLDGHLIAATAMVNVALGLRQAGIARIVSAPLPTWTPPIPDVSLYLFDTLAEVALALRQPDGYMVARDLPSSSAPLPLLPDMDDVAGQDDIKRGLMVAAIGRHHTLLVGPPGCGKTMLTERFVSILPHLTQLQMLEVHAIQQAASCATIPTPIAPVRMPHHSVTTAGMIGGTAHLVPGEVTLAHRGVLIVDELLEFQRSALESLRGPLVTRAVRLHRGGRNVTLPADFQLLATLNPCPCGQRGFRACQCKDVDVARYWSRLSGALADRLEMSLAVRPVPHTVQAPESLNTGASMQQRVANGRRIREALCRTARTGEVYPRDAISHPARLLVQRAAAMWGWSERAVQAVSSVAISICALEQLHSVGISHMEEAIALRGQVLPSNALRT